jgi:hypothetical protein
MQLLTHILWLKKVFKDFLIGKWKWIPYDLKAYLFHDYYFEYVVEAFYHIELENII